MPGRLRITIGTAEQNALLVEALASLVLAHA
jgi:histidinol-phosphate/aromatic aminotransferase/cobyric acid decarboxylase-like protein